ncbi:putative proteasome inhibitor [Ananas comosus]|uniref:Putative proteasome inhibitor n=1 Tax=Ananas comosus TaxID=4615 RepID=A0A199UFW6_ANACO|nr:putative proteasome inhibitor [Ananas comosus]
MATESSAMAVIRASRPFFRNSHDKVAFAVHASFLAAGYSLAAAGKSAFTDHLPSGEEEVGIDGWNELEDRYAFVYFKNEKGVKKRVLVKCLAIGDKLAVDVLNLEGEQKEPLHLQINVKDYLSDDGVDQPRNYGDMYKDLKGFVESLKSSVLDKLEDGYERKLNAKVETSSSSRSYEGPDIDLNTPESVVGVPAEDQRQPPNIVYPPVPPFDYNDAIPGPGAGFYPNRGPGIGGDMLVGPNNPIFFPPGGRPDTLGGLPGVPPGARFDPIGPPDVPGFEPGRFVRRQRRPGGGTHPDLEFFQQGPDFI